MSKNQSSFNNQSEPQTNPITIRNHYSIENSLADLHNHQNNFMRSNSKLAPFTLDKGFLLQENSSRLSIENKKQSQPVIQRNMSLLESRNSSVRERLERIFTISQEQPKLLAGRNKNESNQDIKVISTLNCYEQDENASFTKTMRK